MKNRNTQKKRYRLGALALTFAMILTLLPAGVLQVHAAAGTEEDPILLDNTNFRSTLEGKNITAGSYYKLKEDINLTDKEWTPTKAFSGTLDGAGYTVTLKIGTSQNRTEMATAGLIQVLNAGAVLKNIHANVAIYVTYSVAGTMQVGGLVGYAYGSVIGCTVSGNVSVVAEGTNTKIDCYVGGIVGRARATQAGMSVVIANCTNHAAVSIENKNKLDDQSYYRFNKAAGIVGYMHADNVAATLSLYNCVNTRNITAPSDTDANSQAAGIAGTILGSASCTAQMSNCVNTGAITAYKPRSVAVHNAESTQVLADLYALEGSSKTMATNNDTVSKTADELQSTAFLAELNTNAAEINDNLTAPLVQKWTKGADGQPVPNGSLAVGRLLTVTWTPSHYGSVGLSAQAPGERIWTKVEQVDFVTDGSTVKLTFDPLSGCAVDTVTVNGQNVSVTEASYEFIVTAHTEVQISFKIGTAEELGPIYVDPNAAASGDGKTPETAFRTLPEAINAVTDLLQNKINNDVTVYLMGGRHILNETIVLGEEQTTQGRVIIKNYENHTPVVTGAQEITGTFTRVAGKNYYSYQLPDSTKVGNAWPEFRDLLVNGQRATLAKTKEYIFTQGYTNAVIEPETNKITSVGNLFYIDADVAAGIETDDLHGMEIVSLVEWKSQLFHVAGITHVAGSETQIVLNETELKNFNDYDATKRDLKGRAYYLQNHLNFLDEPGEFWYDSENGTIYYYPYTDQNMTDVTVEYATLDKLIDIQGGANFTFEGIEFTGTTANFVTQNGLVAGLGACYYTRVSDPGTNVPCAAIWAEGVTGIQVLNCKFHDLAGHGFLSNYGTKDLVINGNIFKDLGMSGVIVGVNQRQWNEAGLLGASENVTITNNYVTNVGVTVPCAPAIKVARSENLKINHNTIIHVSYSAIMAGWGWNVNADKEAYNKNLINAEIAYNYVEDFLYGINDGGAIYTCGANGFADTAGYFNRVHDNYIRGGAHNKAYIGIYHDGSSSNWHTYHNVIEDIKSTHGPIFFQDDVPSQYSHNILAENNFTTASPITQDGKVDSLENPRNIFLRNNVMFADRSKLSAEAQGIKENAGLEPGYAADPMDIELRIEDATMRYTYMEGQTAETECHIRLTNNADSAKTFTLSIIEGLTNCIISGNGVTVQAGGSTVITVTFDRLDANLGAGDHIFGFQVMDETGRTVCYPRAFAFTQIRVAGSTTDDKITFKSTSLILEEEVKMKFYMNVSGSFTASGLQVWTAEEYAALGLENGTEPGTNAVPTATYSGFTVADTQWTITTDGVAAKKMGDSVHVRAYIVDNDGVIHYTKIIEHSPQKWAQYMVSKENTNYPKDRPVAIALMNYGAAAQQYFDYKTEALMNAFLNEDQQKVGYSANQLTALKTLSDGKFTFEADTEKIKITTASLVLEGATDLKLYCTIDPSIMQGAQEAMILYWSGTQYETLTSLSRQNITGIGNLIKNGNSYSAKVTDIAAKELGETYFACVYVKDAQGNEHYSSLICCSVHQYCNYMITNERPEIDFCKAMVVYSDAAKTRFSNQEE